MDELTNHMTGNSPKTSKEDEEEIIISIEEKEDDDLMMSDFEVISNTREEVDEMDDLEM